MQTLNQSLADLYLKKIITYDDAIQKSQEPGELKRILSGSEQTGDRMERRTVRN